LLLLLLFLGVLARLVMADHAAYGGAGQTVVMSKMTGDAAGYGAFDTSFGVRGARCASEGECQNRAGQNRFHAKRSH
jgi:hypothetical protein